MSDARDRTVYDSWNKISIDEVVYNHKITVANFNKVVSNYSIGKYLQCDPFTIPVKDINIPVEVKVYPKGSATLDTDYVWVKVRNAEEESVVVDIERAIVDREGKKQRIHKHDTVKDWGKQKPTPVIRLVKRSQLFEEGSNLLDADGNLTIALKFTIEQSNTVNRSFTARDDAVEDTTSHTDHMKNMLENAEEFFSDVEIECMDGIIPCHSSILASKTPVLKAMFTVDMLEARTRKVNMKSLTKELVFNILTFIYTGKIDTDDISLVMLKEADKLGLVDLVTECSKHLSKHLNVTNCVPTIILADRIVNTNILKMAAKQFILDNLTTQVMQDIKKDCDKDLMIELLEEANKNAPPAKRRRTQEVSR